MENITIGGLTLAMLKKLNGAAFNPAGPSVQTKAMGRGTTALVINFACCDSSRSLQSTPWNLDVEGACGMSASPINTD
jgi:hypothetical protein